MSTTQQSNDVTSSVTKQSIELHQQLRHLDCIGFDMDMTIVRYKNDALLVHIYDCLQGFLAQEFAHLGEAKLDHEICHRGIVIDVETGNILKLNYKKRVIKAYLGKLEVSKQTIEETYHSAAIPEENPLHSFTGMSNSRFFSLHSFFELPVASLWASHVQHLISVASVATFDKSELTKFLKTLIGGFRENFNNFTQGKYYQAFREDPGRFVYQATEKCINWLKQMKKDGVKVLLITNSRSQYTHLLMTYCYGENFQELFDLVLTDAKKPEFFKLSYDKPFSDLQTYFPKEYTKEMFVDHVEFNTPTVYHEGNVQTLINSVRKSLGKGDNDEISFCYVGDHLIGDVQMPKQSLKWMTIAIVEEIEDPNEIIVLKKQSTGVKSSGSTYEWGSFFHSDGHTGDSHTAESTDTFWANIVRENSDIAIASVEGLVDYFNQSAFDHESLKPCAIAYPLPQ
eukprot:gene13907-16407_t